jgi:hypothetical protein
MFKEHRSSLFSVAVNLKKTCLSKAVSDATSGL